MKSKWSILGLALVLDAFLVCGCGLIAGRATEEPIRMPNPASVHCEEQGYRLEIRTDEDGGQYGVCLFPDGSECEEWAYFRGECEPGEEASPGETGLANPASVYCEEQGYTLEIRTSDDGGQYGVCLFPDGSECEEWAYFRGECEPGQEEPSGGIGVANPASVYCEEQGYRLEIRTGEDGGQHGVCLFPDGSECEEWAYFRGECEPGQGAETGEEEGALPPRLLIGSWGRVLP